jgi:hypothetical protein
MDLPQHWWAGNKYFHAYFLNYFFPISEIDGSQFAKVKEYFDNCEKLRQQIST